MQTYQERPEKESITNGETEKVPKHAAERGYLRKSIPSRQGMKLILRQVEIVAFMWKIELNFIDFFSFCLQTEFHSTESIVYDLSLFTILQNITSMDDDVELEVLLVTLFGLIAQMFMEVNTFVVLMSYGFLKIRRKSRRRSCLDRTHSIRSKVPGQIEKLHYLVEHRDETCKNHLRMNTDYFNRLCYLLRNLGGLRDTRNMHNVLLATHEPVPEDNNDYPWKYFKADVFTKSLKNKAFPFYTTRCEIFGNDTTTRKTLNYILMLLMR
ncbi:hypothetical protein ACS0TY_004367 [Phlomoides rotata]